MKNLKIKHFDNFIELDDIFLLSICFENQKILMDCLNYCYNDFPSRTPFFLLEYDNESVKVDEVFYFVQAPYSLDFNSKKNINVLNKILRKKYNSNFKQYVADVEKLLKDLSSEICLDFDLELESQIDFTEDSLLKILNFNFKFEEENDCVSSFIKFIRTINELFGFSLIVIPFLRNYFTDDQITFIEKELKYLNVKMISLENIFVKNPLSFERRVFIDNDLCTLE